MQGNPKAGRYMTQIADAIKRHLPCPSAEFTDIYNRAYEAINDAIQDASQLSQEGENK